MCGGGIPARHAGWGRGVIYIPHCPQTGVRAKYSPQTDHPAVNSLPHVCAGGGGGVAPGRASYLGGGRGGSGGGVVGVAAA